MELNQPNCDTRVWIGSGSDCPEANVNFIDHIIAEEANNRQEIITVLYT